MFFFLEGLPSRVPPLLHEVVVAHRLRLLPQFLQRGAESLHFGLRGLPAEAKLLLEEG